MQPFSMALCNQLLILKHCAVSYYGAAYQVTNTANLVSMALCNQLLILKHYAATHYGAAYQVTNTEGLQSQLL